MLKINFNIKICKLINNSSNNNKIKISQTYKFKIINFRIKNKF